MLKQMKRIFPLILVGEGLDFARMCNRKGTDHCAIEEMDKLRFVPTISITPSQNSRL